MRGIFGRFAPWALVAGLLLTGCGTTDTLPADPAGDSNELPASHTDLEGGVAHMPGKSNPTTNCVSCHGQDLRGGDDGEPSCYSCHGRVW